MADELLDPHRHLEEVLQDRRQPLGVAHLPDERADVKELGDDRARASRSRNAAGDEAEERADVDGEAIVVRAGRG